MTAFAWTLAAVGAGALLMLVDILRIRRKLRAHTDDRQTQLRLLVERYPTPNGRPA